MCSVRLAAAPSALPSYSYVCISEVDVFYCHFLFFSFLCKWSNPENTNTHFSTDGAPRIGTQRTWNDHGEMEMTQNDDEIFLRCGSAIFWFFTCNHGLYIRLCWRKNLYQMPKSVGGGYPPQHFWATMGVHVDHVPRTQNCARRSLHDNYTSHLWPTVGGTTWIYVHNV